MKTEAKTTRLTTQLQTEEASIQKRQASVTTSGERKENNRRSLVAKAKKAKYISKYPVLPDIESYQAMPSHPVKCSF